MSILSQINGPDDVKALAAEQLPSLAEEIRQRIIQVTSRNGGHIGPNLGVVELTLALHRQFSTPKDQFVFDVSHQGYVHKLLTGRKGDGFETMRHTGGLSGFLNRSESDHDAWGAGHAGTALSAALGLAVARDMKQSDSHVVSVVGDAAFTCGITMEALNNVAAHTNRLIIILNDNEWSIAKNVGALATYFNELITNPVYQRFDKDMHKLLKRVPGGDPIIRLAKKWKKGTKDFIVSSSLFETYGVRYLGPIDGHDIPLLERYLSYAKQADHPVLLHVLTKKGRGYEPALAAPEKFHGTTPFDIQTGKGQKKDGPPNYQDAFGQALLRFAEADENIVGITAAMPPGTGLVYMREKRPKQFFDVGIAEEHAVLFAAGMASQGAKPVVAIYSTFLQRAYDCIIHDVCLQNLPVVFCMDRAGLSPNDGPTHHGLFDISYLRCVPNVTLMQPKDEDELTDMLWTSLNSSSPCFIRYPKGSGTGEPIKQKPTLLPIGRAEVLEKGQDVQFWALGPWVQVAQRFAQRLSEHGISAGVVNARFVKPLDTALLKEQVESGARLIVTMEDHVVQGGFGTCVLEALNAMELDLPVETVGWPDNFVGHASTVADLRRENGLDDDTIYERVLNRCRSLAGEAAQWRPGH